MVGKEDYCLAEAQRKQRKSDSTSAPRPLAGFAEGQSDSSSFAKASDFAQRATKDKSEDR